MEEGAVTSNSLTAVMLVFILFFSLSFFLLYVKEAVQC